MTHNHHQSLEKGLSVNNIDNPAEKDHWRDVCRSFRQYATFGQCQWDCRASRWQSLSADQQAALPRRLQQGTEEFNACTNEFSQALIRNQFFVDCILRQAGMPHSQQQKPSDDDVYSTDEQISKVTSVLKSVARDWSIEGAPERAPYTILMEQLKQYVAVGREDGRSRAKVCVPGAGVGRLACEICSMGYHVQGNEFSLYMLLASDFVLNAGLQAASMPISPYLLETRNHHSMDDALRAVRIPDICPHELLQRPNESKNQDTVPPPDFSMAAGDFNSIYCQEIAEWDAVAACFFLDATPNIVETLQTIHKMLRVGGHLLSFGPLLWHWSGPPMRPDETVWEYRNRYRNLDCQYLDSIEVTWEDAKEILRNIGFRILVEDTHLEASYTADERSMMKTTYRCVNFVAQKT